MCLTLVACSLVMSHLLECNGCSISKPSMMTVYKMKYEIIRQKFYYNYSKSVVHRYLLFLCYYTCGGIPLTRIKPKGRER